MLIARQAMELIGGGKSLQEATSHLGINHFAVAAWVKKAETPKPEDKRNEIQLITTEGQSIGNSASVLFDGRRNLYTGYHPGKRAHPGCKINIGISATPGEGWRKV